MRELTPPTPTIMTMQFNDQQLNKIVSAMAVPSTQIVERVIPTTEIATKEVSSKTLGISKPRESTTLEQVKAYLLENPELQTLSGAKGKKWLSEHKGFDTSPQWINEAKRNLKEEGLI